MTDPPENIDARVDAIHDHLAACLERPVERTASRWIGEAEAVARDVAEADLEADVVAERLGHVRDLLAEVEGTGDERADQRVEEANQLTATVLDDLE